MNENDEFALLERMKNQLRTAAKNNDTSLQDEDFGSYRWNNSKKKGFYLRNYRKNLFESETSETELGEGVEAVRSSAAMIFNILGQKPVTINGRTFNAPQYEFQMPAIYDTGKNKHNAHLDAVMTSADKSELLAIEAKLLEWTNSPKNLSRAYLDSSKYLNGKNDVFIKFFTSLVDTETIDSKGQFVHTKEKYDAIQMTIHILALYNYCSEKESQCPKKISLKNVVWKYECDDYHTEEKEGKEFISQANETFVPVFRDIGFDFQADYITAQDFIKSIDFTNDVKRKEYIEQRYILGYTA